MSDLTPEYLAGLFDGEGCVGIYSNGVGYLACSVQIELKYLPVLEQIAEQFGGYIYSRDSRDTHQWCSRKRSIVENFLTTVAPHLHEKKAQADLALLWLQGVIGAEARDMMKELKVIAF